MSETVSIGLDVGSVTAKTAVLNSAGDVLFSKYMRHNANARVVALTLLEEICEKFPEARLSIALTGSGALSLSEELGMLFVQEVIVCIEAIRAYIPQTNVAIELGGEDGKITFFDETGIDQRMNEACAGGTGAFIDQMATVLKTDAQGLDILAKEHTHIYPVAARCGVFAKTDILPLLNEGAARSDIAASIFQAVADQTIGGLACGRSIKGNVAFLGGPLTFLPQLRERFIHTLKLPPEQVIEPENAQFFVALGASQTAMKKATPFPSDVVLEKVKLLWGKVPKKQEAPLPPLFQNPEDAQKFLKRHDRYQTPHESLIKIKGPVFVGLDAGSTTTKMVVLDEEKRLLHTWYQSNEGDPLASARAMLLELYELLPANAYIQGAGVTGYGELLLKSALEFDIGEVETVAHFTAAAFFEPKVSFILDIGGQDMKCIYITDGVIDKIVLNEACSSGCGSFIETFSTSLGLSISDFVKKALFAKEPVDLGSRCTVFMNSKIKQAQKEGTDIDDIAAGLAYSVVRNALFKVIRIAGPEELGEHVVVQGGTFLNNAVLRAFEQTIQKEVVRPDISGNMGAFGMALLTIEQTRNRKEKSSLLSQEKIAAFQVIQKTARCRQCSNQCLMTVNIFDNGKKFVSGNRCEKGVQTEINVHRAPNLYEYKYDRLFNEYVPTKLELAYRGEIGIPRVLNMYEDYPLWFTILTKLGFRVVLSDPSSKTLFNTGLETIPSQTVCYPAKMVHGHIINLLEKGIKVIFYPCVPKSEKEFLDAHNYFNCPVVGSYPELIRLNLDILKSKEITYLAPFLPVGNKRRLASRLAEVLEPFGVLSDEVRVAVRAGKKESARCRKDIQQKGAELLETIKVAQKIGIVVAGRPYHVDPAINHGIAQKISEEGIAVFTEDSIAHLNPKFRKPLDVVDQWTYHSRLYRAANVVAHTPNLEFVQLTSFGCGIDALTAEQAENILKEAHKTYTLLKIDEGANLGAVRIRLRSLFATIRQRREKIQKYLTTTEYVSYRKGKLSEDMARDYTLLCPQMSPLHFEFVNSAIAPFGYNVEVLPDLEKSVVLEEGLRYVHNDACYPAIIVVGQMIAALKSGKYNLDKIALMITQTSGACRATNYVTFLRSALEKAGFAHVPVVTINMKDLDGIGIRFIMAILKRVLLGLSFGDLLMRVSNRTRPYEKMPGATDALLSEWLEKSKVTVLKGDRKTFKRQVFEIVKDFEAIPLLDVQKTKVGIVGEILVKFHPGANNHLISVIEEEGGEAVVPDLIDFINYCLVSDITRHRLLEGSFKSRILSTFFLFYIETFYRRHLAKALRKSKKFLGLTTTRRLSEKVSDIVSLGHCAGEGWLLTAEMVELIEENVPNIVCVQPFGCLPNHITGKGVIKELKSRYRTANIVAIDYDPGASEVNQVNRIKLMMGMIKQDLAEKK